jgi:hypothetical protein
VGAVPELAELVRNPGQEAGSLSPFSAVETRCNRSNVGCKRVENDGEIRESTSLSAGFALGGWGSFFVAEARLIHSASVSTSVAGFVLIAHVQPVPSAP